jgi:hypothetical protein
MQVNKSNPISSKSNDISCNFTNPPRAANFSVAQLLLPPTPTRAAHSLGRGVRVDLLGDKLLSRFPVADTTDLSEFLIELFLCSSRRRMVWRTLLVPGTILTPDFGTSGSNSVLVSLKTDNEKYTNSCIALSC